MNSMNSMNRDIPLKRIMRCLHIVMILMPVICAVNISVTNRNDTAMWQMTLCSLFLLVPTVVSRLAERRIGSFAANLLIDAGLIVLTGLFAWQAGGLVLGRDLRTELTVVLPVLAFFCVQGSITRRLVKASREKALKQHDLSWQKPHYFLDTPSVRYELWFLILYLLGLLFSCPVMCNIALCLGALYLVLAMFYERIDGTDAFLQELHEVSHIPIRRVRLVGDAAVGVFSLFCMLLAGAAALLAPLRRYLDLREWHTTVPVYLMEYGTTPEANKYQSEILEEIEQLDVVRRDPLPWLEPLAIILAVIALLLLIRLLLKQLRHTAAVFREGFDENGDYIRSLEPEEEVTGLRRRRRRERPVTEQDKIRREYRKRVEKQLPGGPALSDTPDEIERKARIEDPALHERYERARYEQPPGAGD